MTHDLSRRNLLHGGVGALWLGDAAGAASRQTPGRGRKLDWVLDMVHNNPGEARTVSAFNAPGVLASYGYNAQVLNDFVGPQAVVTFDSLSPDILPAGSPERQWAERAAASIDVRIAAAHAAGIQAFYFTDMIVLPKRLIAHYGDQILSGDGKIDLDRPMTIAVLRAQIAEIFARFPGLDGLVVRTGETYLQDLPYHGGNNPIRRGADSHVALLELFREEICVKRGKRLFYRTWSFDGFHTDPAYYLSVADRIQPHDNLVFSIKHVANDFFRTQPFNPTLTLGKHGQIVEVQCQREYEGKGAFPNYIAQGVIDGFEEDASKTGAPKCLRDIAGHPNFRGVWTWSRGGGWRGPYIQNELWCDLNAFVMARWAGDVAQAEAPLFAAFARRKGVSDADLNAFRRLALLSAAGVLRGHYSQILRLRRPTWTRDHFLGGSDQDLKDDFDAFLAKPGAAEGSIREKAQGAQMWEQIAEIAPNLRLSDPDDAEYLKLSAQYGRGLHLILYHGWAAMMVGALGERSGQRDQARLDGHLHAYDAAWTDYQALRENHPRLCPSLYRPYSFGRPDAKGVYDADLQHGMKPSLDRYRS